MGNGGKEGKGHQRTYIKDPQTKPRRGSIEGRRWGWMGWGKVVVGKWRQLYLNNNKNKNKYIEENKNYTVAVIIVTKIFKNSICVFSHPFKK